LWRRKVLKKEVIDILPDRGESLKRLHRPNLLGFCWIRFKEKLGFQDHGVSTLIALNAGLMKFGRDLPGRATKAGGGQRIWNCVGKYQTPLQTETDKIKITSDEIRDAEDTHP